MRAIITAASLIALLTPDPVLQAGERAGDFALPRKDLTPGATRAATIAELCSKPVPVMVGGDKQRVFDRYGIPPDRRDSYVIDWLIPPELGGADSIKNLWPQLTVGPLNHGDKVKLEDELHAEVCAGKLPLAEAQEELRTDWPKAYLRVFGSYP